MPQINTRKPKVLILSQNPCYPLTHGGAIGQYYIIDGLKDQVDFVYCTLIDSLEALNDLKLLQSVQPNLKIYFTNTIKKQSILNRLENTLKFHYKAVKLMVFCFLKKDRKTNNINNTNDDFFNADFISINTNIDKNYMRLVDEIIIKENITQVQLDFFASMPFALIFMDNIKKIFVCHELRYKRLELAAQTSTLSVPYKQFIINRMRFYEENLLKKMDCIITLNEDDAERVKKINHNIVSTKNAMPDVLIYKKEASKIFNKFIFSAGEEHTPNSLGLSWFLDTIYIPNMKNIPFQMHVIGKWSKNYRKKYKQYKQIMFCGFVESMKPYFENSILINPILTGAGIRMKILHALANKVPVFSTVFGAEGCYSDNEKEHLFFFNSPEEFMRGIEFVDNLYLERLALAGNAYYNRVFNKEKILRQRLEIYTQ
jgi:hypothetical protein